jgi:hypothetical protein
MGEHEPEGEAQTIFIFTMFIEQVVRVTVFVFLDCLTLDSTILRNVGH